MGVWQTLAIAPCPPNTEPISQSCRNHAVRAIEFKTELPVCSAPVTPNITLRRSRLLSVNAAIVARAQKPAGTLIATHCNVFQPANPPRGHKCSVLLLLAAACTQRAGDCGRSVVSPLGPRNQVAAGFLPTAADVKACRSSVACVRWALST